MDDYNLLTEIAHATMLERGLQPDFSNGVFKQLEQLTKPANSQQKEIRDQRDLLWCSIDNDDSKDLDQVTVAYQLPDGKYNLSIAIADVDALVTQSTPIDQHALINTTSVYTPTIIFPMLPIKLSTNLTSLNENEDRLAIVFEIIFSDKMEMERWDIYRAQVHNKAQLTYSAVGAWIEEKEAIPQKVSDIPGMKETLQLQDQLAQSIKRKRQSQGALTFETIEMKTIIKDDKIVNLVPLVRNRAHELIENLMIAANTVSAKYSVKHQLPGIRRVVRVPERWDRIVDLAASLGEDLPPYPDALALDAFLNLRKKKEPETFPDLSIAIIKLMGSGEYVVERPGDEPIGHFGLALRDYTHSTAPNRRFPDLVTQRLLKASLQNKTAPYSNDELEALAKRCTECEDMAVKVERKLKKCASAMLLENRVGESFQAIVTGSGAKGTWVRLTKIPIEGKLIANIGNADVGDKIMVKLTRVDVTQGFIDFARLK